MLTRTRGVVLAVVGLSLAACSNVHPGAAAVVDGRTISMKTLDRSATAYCALTLNAAQQQGVTTLSGAEMRRQAVVGLVSLVVARDLARTENLTIQPSAYELTSADRAQISKAFPDSDQREVARVIEDTRQVSAIAIALAEKQTNQTATAANEAQFTELGQKTILSAFRGSDVKFSPRFGLDPAAQPRADTGAIAVTPVDAEAPVDEELPDALRCS